MRSWTTVLLMVALAGGVAHAAADTDEPAPLDGWEFDVAPYMWLPTMHGTATAAGRTAQVNVGFDEIFDLIGDDLSLLAGMLHVEARHGRFAGFLDFTGTTLDTDESVRLKGVDSPEFPGLSTTKIDTRVDLRQDTIFLEFGMAYRALELAMPNRTRPFALEALAGGRYMYYWTSVNATANTTIQGLPQGSQAVQRAASAHGTVDWVDPFIGGRFLVPLTDDIEFSFRGDIGGFGAGSDLAWSLVSFLRYDLPFRPFDARTWFAVGYKVLAFDYDAGSAELDFQYRGPGTTLGMTF